MHTQYNFNIPSISQNSESFTSFPQAVRYKHVIWVFKYVKLSYFHASNLKLKHESSKVFLKL